MIFVSGRGARGSGGCAISVRVPNRGACRAQAASRVQILNASRQPRPRLVDACLVAKRFQANLFAAYGVSSSEVLRRLSEDGHGKASDGSDRRPGRLMSRGSGRPPCQLEQAARSRTLMVPVSPLPETDLRNPGLLDHPR